MVRPTAPQPALARACTLHQERRVLTLHWMGTDLGEAELDEAARDVDAATLDRIRLLRRPEDRRRSLVTHALARRALAPLLGTSPARVPLGRRCGRCGSTRHGRPCLEALGHAAPEVSLAHTDDVAVVLVAGPGSPVGVDVEPRRRHEPDWRLAVDTVLSRSERVAVDAAADPQWQRVRAWTGKEAVAKATGAGLGEELTRTDVLGASRRPDGWWQVGVPEALLAYPPLGTRYVAAVAVLAS